MKTRTSVTQQLRSNCKARRRTGSQQNRRFCQAELRPELVEGRSSAAQRSWAVVGLAAVLSTLLLVAVACSGAAAGSNPASETPAVGVTQVRLQDFGFAPASIVIDAGTTVTWTNYDGLDHTVTSDEGDVFDSERLGEDGTFSHTFDTPGEYYYHSELHAGMQGLVTVLPTPKPYRFI